MTNIPNGGRDIGKGKGGLVNKAKMETLVLEPTKRTRNKLVTATLVAVAIATGIGITDTLFTTAAYHNTVTSKQCVQTPVKMFDESNVPKYFIGPGYKVSSIDPKVTDVVITICK